MLLLKLAPKLDVMDHEVAVLSVLVNGLFERVKKILSFVAVVTLLIYRH